MADAPSRDELDRLIRAAVDRALSERLSSPEQREQIRSELDQYVVMPLGLTHRSGGHVDWTPVLVAKEWGKFFENHKMATYQLVTRSESQAAVMQRVWSGVVGAVLVGVGSVVWNLVMNGVRAGGF